MPGSQREVANAEEEGVDFVWLSAPEAFDGVGKVSGVRATKMRLGQPDASGRRAPEPDPGSAFALEADLVIQALGFDPEDLPGAFGPPDLGPTRWVTLRHAHRPLPPRLSGVFSAGTH